MAGLFTPCLLCQKKAIQAIFRPTGRRYPFTSMLPLLHSRGFAHTKTRVMTTHSVWHGPCLSSLESVASESLPQKGGPHNERDDNIPRASRPFSLFSPCACGAFGANTPPSPWKGLKAGGAFASPHVKRDGSCLCKGSDIRSRAFLVRRTESSGEDNPLGRRSRGRGQVSPHQCKNRRVRR